MDTDGLMMGFIVDCNAYQRVG